MRYVAARVEEYFRDYTYRIYVARGLKLLAGLNMDLTDILNPVNTPSLTKEETLERINNGLREVRGE